MNIYKFKKACDACGKTYDDVASLLGCKRESLRKKFGPNGLSSDEVTRLARLLNLGSEDLTEIFYPELLSVASGVAGGRQAAG